MNGAAQAGTSARCWRTWLAAALIVACGLAAYSNSFTSLFLGLDGKQSIRDNPHIRRIWPLSEALSIPLWPTSRDLEAIRNAIITTELDLARAVDVEALARARQAHTALDDTPTVAFRPVFSLSLALTNHFIGVEPPAHHAVNIAIHILAALVLFGIVRRSLSPERFPGFDAARSTGLALAAALLWLAHPLQTESVTYIVQRAESLMGLFLLLTVYCAVRAVDSPRRLWWQAVAVFASILSAGAKQTGGFVWLLVLLYDYTVVTRSRERWSRPFFYLLLAAPLWTILVTHGLFSDGGAMSARFDPLRYLSYAMAQPGVVLHYVWITVWPADLFLYVNTRVFEVQSVREVLASTAILVAVFVATGYAIARRHWLGLVGGWFFVTLAPTSSFFDANDLIQEHRMYVPLAALAVLAATGGDFALRQATQGLSERVRTVAGATVLSVVVLALGTRTYIRNWDYHHEFGPIHPADLHGDYTILADHYLSKEGLIEVEADRARALLASPNPDRRDVSFAHFVIALAHASNGELEDAEAEFERVLDLEPGFAYAYQQIGIVRRELDDPEGAMESFREAIRINPSFVHAYKEMALTLERMGDTEAAEEELRRTLKIQPGFGEALYELGILALRRGDKEDAAQRFREAIRGQPELAEPHFELGMLRAEAGDNEEAREHFAAAVALQPDFAEAHRALGMVLARLDRPADARPHLERAVELRPDYADAHSELGIVLRQEGKLAEAGEHFARAIELEPESPDFHYQLGRLFAEERDWPRAVEQFQKALERNPDHSNANKDLAAALAERGDGAGEQPPASEPR